MVQTRNVSFKLILCSIEDDTTTFNLFIDRKKYRALQLAIAAVKLATQSMEMEQETLKGRFMMICLMLRVTLMMNMKRKKEMRLCLKLCPLTKLLKIAFLVDSVIIS